MPYTREELFRELKIEPMVKEKTPGEGMLLRVLHERAGVFADEYRKRPYIQKLRKMFGKEFNTKLAKTVEKVFAEMRKNKEWAFLFLLLDDDCPAAVKVYIQMAWSTRTLSMVFEQLEKEAESAES